MTQGSTQPERRPTRRRRRRGPGWVPDQHGAWAMLAVPLLVGVFLGSPAWVHVPLAALWFVGYFAFFATGLWLKSRFKARWWPPVRAYGIATVVPAVAVLLLRPDLLAWVPLFAPLVAVSLWSSYRRSERSLLNDGATVLAACLMLPVAFAAGVGPGARPGAAWPGVWPLMPLPDGVTGVAGIGWLQVWALFVVVLAYFAGTILYVKTLIRERGERSYLVASVVYHLAAGVVASAALAAAGLVWWPAAALFAGLTVRAVWVPRTQATPMQFGMGEVVASVLVTVVVLVLPQTFEAVGSGASGAVGAGGSVAVGAGGQGGLEAGAASTVVP
ncbi:YwiC-like family protein [Oerskovia rustica]|uniref:YwiC-like family protein n=1 Tax=Oerskovia rustica TaxID=2762237 RepID=A0ABR8RUN9_9CELL|nr:YwiC-like family protein [Oerskovia rustica]MBD7951127.1 YwiC-like family protein [Oerskovia rustica]